MTPRGKYDVDAGAGAEQRDFGPSCVQETGVTGERQGSREEHERMEGPERVDRKTEGKWGKRPF